MMPRRDLYTRYFCFLCQIELFAKMRFTAIDKGPTSRLFLLINCLGGRHV